MIRQVETADWERLREVRLRALEDSPWAFASTHERELAFTDEVWRERATPSGGVPGASTSFAAERNGRFDALVSGFVSDDPTTVFLVAMWVAPDLRGRGVGAQLVEAVTDWARAHGAERVCLSVEAGNDSAFRLYTRCAFIQPSVEHELPYEPGADSQVMVREL